MSGIEDARPGAIRPDTRPRGSWLVLGRTIWVVVTALSLGLFALSVPAGFQLLRTVCVDGPCGPEQLRPGGAQSVRDLGVSLDLYAAYQTAVVVVVAVVFCAIAAVVFWRRSNDAVALHTPMTLVLCGVFLPDWVGRLRYTPPSGCRSTC